MGDVLDEEQLLEFCHRLGLAKDGYLDEKDLIIVCNFIGLQAPDEMMKELFEELDGDKDGKVCLAELSQMLRGMHSKKPTSPGKKIQEAGNAATNSMLDNSGAGEFCTIPVSERGAFTILDPQNTGFAKVGNILDLWSQLGISQENGVIILKEMGFVANARSSSINLQDLSKSIEDETDHSKDGLPPLLQAALVTYRTEVQYLRSVCESIECERDKLKSDVYEAHQRSAMLAQEVDEQNSRLERNSQILLQKMEAKYNEQIHELQQRYTTDKEALQQALQLAESQVKALREEDARLKAQITKINNENTHLEREVQNLNQEVRNVNRMKNHLEKELARYVDLENRLHEMEKRSADTIANSDGKLQKAYTEMQLLRDQNDELSTQLEGLRETLKMVKASQEKRYYIKKRKGSSSPRHTPQPLSDRTENYEESNGIPLEKIGKFNPRFELNVLHFTDDQEECDSSIDPLIASSCSQPDSGNFPTPQTISLAACMGESSTDPGRPEDGFTGSSESTGDDEPGQPSKVERLEKQYKTLEGEMDAVKEKIVTIISEKELLLRENSGLRKKLSSFSISETNSSSDNFSKPSITGSSSVEECATQTSICSVNEVDMENVTETEENSEVIQKLKNRIAELEKETDEQKLSFEKEKNLLKEQCANLENSLDLLRVEYEKCEDYWHGKLQDEREVYEQDRNLSDEKFHELALKIKEYEEMFLHPDAHEKLPPIEERFSLEQQVTDLEDECDNLRKELMSCRVEQDSIIGNYQRKWESKMMEECSSLEQQVSALSKKCKDYESRLSTLAEEERSTLEESGMMTMLSDRIKQLEFQLKNQDEKYRQQISHLEKICKEKEQPWRKSTPDAPKSTSPQYGNVWKEEMASPTKSKSLLEMLHQPEQQKVDTFTPWPQRVISADKSASLPFIPMNEPYLTSGWGLTPPTFHQDIWSPPNPAPTKKAWCHVELGWLQALRNKLKQRDEQCYILQRALQQKEMQSEKIIAEMKYQHDAEVSNWESLMQASQELVRQQAIKHKEQAEKLAHSDLLMKDLWMENAKLMAALSATEQRVIQLENLLKFQMSNAANTLPKSHNNNTSLPPPSQHSLPHHHFST